MATIKDIDSIAIPIGFLYKRELVAASRAVDVAEVGCPLADEGEVHNLIGVAARNGEVRKRDSRA